MVWGIAMGVVGLPLEAWPIQTSPRPAATSRVKSGREVKKTKTGPITGQWSPAPIRGPGGPQGGPAASGGVGALPLITPSAGATSCRPPSTPR
jgi:hypothetical protein